MTAFHVEAPFISNSLATDDLSGHMRRLSKWLDALHDQEPYLARSSWLLSGETIEEASRYSAFDSDQPSNEALAVLRAELNCEEPNTPLRHISIWNGNEAEGGADIRYTISCNPMFKSRFELTVRVQDGVSPLGDWRSTADGLSALAEIWDCRYISCGPFFYVDKAVFPDRPGVGWMLFLPRTLTPKEVPEAGALVPVMRDKDQLGTIIVSVTDSIFSMNNPEHIRIANDIEIRLVDQDLLPTFGQIQQAR